LRIALISPHAWPPRDDVAHHLVHRVFVGGVHGARVRVQTCGAQFGRAVLDHIRTSPEQVHAGAEFGQRARHRQAQMRAAATPLHYLVGTPKGRLGKLEKAFLKACDKRGLMQQLFPSPEEIADL
jgi:hypothetical protein